MPACKKELPAKKMRGCVRADLDVVPSVVQLAAVLDLDFGPDVASVRRLGLGAAHHAKATVAIQAPADHQAVPRLEDIQREELAREDIVHDEERQHARSVRHILHRFRSPLRSLLLEVGGQDALQRHGDWLLLEAAAMTTDGLVSGGGCHVAGGAGSAPAVKDGAAIRASIRMVQRSHQAPSTEAVPWEPTRTMLSIR